jgi:glycosyltransferase involved in cell wall biosynthesis
VTRGVHFRLLAGGDNRYGYLADTVRVSRPYFRSIRIVDTGSTDDTDTLGNLDGVWYHALPDWNDNWPYAYMTSIDDVPMGDWFLFLDSDERPGQRLLEYLANEIGFLDRKGLNAARIPGVYHLDGKVECADPARILESWPQSHDEYLQKQWWTRQTLVKRLPSTTAVAFGGHCSFRQTQESFQYLPYHYNHYKSCSQLAASAVLCSWSCLESYAVPVGSPEHNRHEELRRLTGLWTANDLSADIAAAAVPDVLLDYWKTLQHSPYAVLRDYWKYAFEFHFRIELALQPCGQACCHYACGQL